MKKSSLESFGQRLQQLVELYAGGNVRAAARRVGVSHPTMLALLGGRSAPRVSTVRKVATAFDVSVGWLVDGEGRGPEPDLPAFGMEEWNPTLRSIHLSDGTGAAIFEISMTLHHFVALAAYDKAGLKPGDDPLKALDGWSGDLIRALRMNYKAWTILFSDWIAAAGEHRVREHLEQLSGRLKRLAAASEELIPVVEER